MSILSTSASLNGVMRWRDGNKGGNHMPSVTRHILGNSLKRFEASSCPRRRLASDRIFSSDDVRHSIRMIFSYCGFCNSMSTRATLNDEAKTILRGWQIAQMEAGGCSPWVFPSDRGDTHVNPTNFYHRVWMPRSNEPALPGVHGMSCGTPSRLGWPCRESLKEPSPRCSATPPRRW